jgi:hypothetical protein
MLCVRNASSVPCAAVLMQSLYGRAESVSKDMDPRGVCDLLYSIAQCPRRVNAHASDALLAALMDRAANVSDSCNTRDISNMLWALARMHRRPDTEALSALLDQVVNLADQLSPQDASTLMWALAAFPQPPGDEVQLRALVLDRPGLIAGLAECISDKAESFRYRPLCLPSTTVCPQLLFALNYSVCPQLLCLPSTTVCLSQLLFACLN